MNATKTASYSALLIPVDIDQDVRRVDVPRQRSLETLQELVGGDIEAVPVFDPRAMEWEDSVTSYVNSEGKFAYMDATRDERREALEKTMNVRATRLMGPGLRAGDFVAGDFVICGFDPREGENLDLVDSVEKRLEYRRELPAPAKVKEKPRSYEARWLLRTESGDGSWSKEKRHYAVLDCGHSTAGINYFSGTTHPNHFFAGVRNSEEEDLVRGGTLVSFTLGSGSGIFSEEITRFSAKRFAAFVERAIDRLYRLYGDSDPRVTRYFEVEGGGAL